MSCALLFCLAGLYAETGIGYVDKPPTAMEWVYKESPAQFATLKVSSVPNPMGRIAIGHEWEAGRYRFNLELRHESSLSTGQDKGQNSAWASAKVFPWRQK
jgi:hypothetical protein